MDERMSQVRTVERWGLVAGVTGVAANGLLAAMFALAPEGVGDFAWTGPANDVIGGIVSTSAMIPVALALEDVVDGRLVRLTTPPAVLAMGAIVGSSALLVSGVLPFEVQVWMAGPAVVLLFGWTAAVGHEGGRTRVLPRRVARWGKAIGLAGLVAPAVVGLGLLLPEGSLARYVVAGAGLAVGLPAYVAFPIWLIALSTRLRTHLDARGDRPAPPAAPTEPALTASYRARKATDRR